MLPENVKKACELACGPGDCKYVVNDEPYCVIGQLAVLEGCTVEELRAFKERVSNDGSYSDGVLALIEHEPFKTKLDKYHPHFMDLLQSFWDETIKHSNKELLSEAESLYPQYHDKDGNKL